MEIDLTLTFEKRRQVELCVLCSECFSCLSTRNMSRGRSNQATEYSLRNPRGWQTHLHYAQVSEAIANEW